MAAGAGRGWCWALPVLVPLAAFASSAARCARGRIPPASPSAIRTARSCCTASCEPDAASAGTCVRAACPPDCPRRRSAAVGRTRGDAPVELQFAAGGLQSWDPRSRRPRRREPAPRTAACRPFELSVAWARRRGPPNPRAPARRTRVPRLRVRPQYLRHVMPALSPLCSMTARPHGRGACRRHLQHAQRAAELQHQPDHQHGTPSHHPRPAPSRR